LVSDPARASPSGSWTATRNNHSKYLTAEQIISADFLGPASIQTAFEGTNLRPFAASRLFRESVRTG
jgi:hypothetical protein